MNVLTFDEARSALEAGKTSCEALVLLFLDRIEERNPDLNAFVLVDRDGVLSRARKVDSALASGRSLPLAGMVVAVKDTICSKGQQVSCGSRMLDGFQSLYSATVVVRLEEAGAVIVGRTNCDEFGMGSSNETSFFGPVRNPLDRERVPGGSSGGSAAAVAAGLCHVALGTDTGGSIRQPAAFCGIVGLKPTYGRVSRYGLVAYASSFDTIGPMAATVADTARVLAIISGKDPCDSTCTCSPTGATSNDSTCTCSPTGATSTSSLPSVKGFRVGLPVEYYGKGLSDDVRNVVMQAASALEEAGAEVREVSLPRTPYCIAAYYVLATAEASSNLSRYDGVLYGLRVESETDGSALAEMYASSRSEGFGKEAQRRIMLGTYVLSAGYYDAYYGKAQRVRTLIRQDFERAFREVDILLTPTTPTTAFRLGDKLEDPLQMYLSDVYTVSANLAGIPGMSVPFGSAPSGLPVGVQLLGPAFREDRLLEAGRVLEWHAENERSG